MFDVCVVGSANLDLVAVTDRRPAPGETVLGRSFAEHPGGKGLNQAVAAARAGASVAFTGAVGRDAAADRLRAVLDGEGIETGALARVDGPTGRAMIVVDDEGENSIVVVAGANAAVVVDAGLPPARVVLVQLEIPLSTVAAALRGGRSAGARTVLNPAPATPLPDALLADVDVVVANHREADALGGIDRLLAQGPSAVVVTRGPDGATVATADGRWEQPAFPVAAVDSTGAGDAFCGVLAAHLAAGGDLRAAVRAGAAAGALATTVPGAVPSLPYAADIAACLR